jgi:HNH endonuclease
MDATTRSRVCGRAGNRCEYCRIHQQHYSITFHVEHIVAQQHHGSNDEANLALACHFCNRHKGPNLAGMDPTTGELTRLFNPRIDTWDQHFQIQAGRIIGLTPVGRTTAYVLNMNRPDRVRVRLELEPETFLG